MTDAHFKGNRHSVRDIAGNVMQDISGLTFEFSPAIIDTTKPIQDGEMIIPADKWYRHGENLDFVLVYDEPVVVEGPAPYLILDFTNSEELGPTTSGGATLLPDDDNNPRTHRFRYTLDEEIYDDNGIDLPSSMSVPSATQFTDIAGNPVERTLSVGAQNLANVKVDSVLEEISVNQITSDNNGIYMANEYATLLVEFNREVKMKGMQKMLIRKPNGETFWSDWARSFDFLNIHGFRFTTRAIHDGQNFVGVHLEEVENIIDRFGKPFPAGNFDIPVEGLRIDTQPPRLIWGEEYDSNQEKKSHTWSWTCQDMGSCSYRHAFSEQRNHYFTTEEGQEAFNGTATYTTPASLTGEYYIHVQARDEAGNISHVFTKKIKLDNASPRVSSILVPSDNTYGKGAKLKFSLIFDKEVTVDSSGGIPSLALTIGQNTRAALYSRGSGGSQLTFEYITQEIEESVTGISLDENISLNGGSIQDSLGNSAALALANIPSLEGIQVNADLPGITIDQAPPYINEENKDRYEVFGSCSEDQASVQLSYIASGVTNSISSVTCNQGGVGVWHYQFSQHLRRALSFNGPPQ